MTEKTSRLPCEETISAVLAALEDQDTSRKALLYAKRRCATLQAMGIDADPTDLVQQVIVDTLSGTLSWKPEACALATHLIGTIKSRTNKLRVRCREFLNRGEQPDGATLHPESQLEAANVWVRIRDALLLDAQNNKDDEVSYVLLAFDDGIHKTEAICEETGLSPEQVKNAKRRMQTLLDALPVDLIQAAKQIGAGL